MKKFLSIILTLMLVVTMTASIVMAEPEETTGEAATQTEAAEGTTEETTEDTTATETPADYDESSIVQYLVFNMQDLDNITIDSYITATDGTLDYYADLYASYGQTMEETEYNGERALSMGQSQLALDDLADAGIAYIADDGFFADKNTFVYVCGTMLSSGFTEGEKIAEIVFDFGSKSESKEIIAGEQNSFMVVKYEVNWINVLIAAMCLVVLVLLVLIIVLTMRKKKSMKVAEENSEYVSEDEVFDTLVAEASEETETEVYEKADETDETVEEASEEN